MRLYADLSTIQPLTSEWKDRLKLATRRVRLLALYTPDQLKALRDVEVKSRDEVDKLLATTTTQPLATTQPADKDKDKDTDNFDAFRIDWHESLRDIRAQMLEEAM